MNDNSFATPRLQDFLASLPDRTLDDVFNAVEWGTRHASIKDETGAVIYTQEVTAPKAWSDLAVNIVASKYFTGSLALGQRENSVRTLITRVAQTIAAQLPPSMLPIASLSSHRTRFAAALGELLLHQKMAFNSPVWFNVGVNEHPQCSACFINSVEDSMTSIMDLAKTEAMLFKGGSGTGTNLSPLRSSKEELNGGGIASGPVSFMRGFDAFAGVIKSGGKTRRAAKMVMLNVDHPDILEFINCKAEEEKKAGVMIDAGYDAIEAYSSVAFQNANHSIRVSDAFMVSALEGYSWDLKARRDGRTVTTVQARDVLMAAAAAAHASGDPGMMFDDTCNDWHTSAADGRINASNPCQPAFATVLTPQGIQTFADIDVGSTIHTSSGWSKVKRKVYTGIKPVQRYSTTAGEFIGTENHRVFQGGERIEVKDTQGIDVLAGVSSTELRLLGADVLAGLMIGDGGVRFANEGKNEYQVLYIGDNDQDYFEDHNVKSLIQHVFDGKAYRVEHVLPTAALDVPAWERQVPKEILHGDSTRLRSFLRGLYSANGSMVGERITLKTTSPKLRQQVQLALSSLGIRSYFTTNKATTVQHKNGAYVSKESYDINITADRRSFATQIGFIQKYKTEKLNNAQEKTTGRGKLTFDVIDVEELGEFPVWDIEVEADCHDYWTGGLRVSNCAEFVYLDDTACNLASLNLLKFVSPATAREFLVDEFVQAVRLTILAQELLVGMSSYPTPQITANSIKFRPLGLGYANLGALLMRSGFAYDSNEGREIAANITSLMTAAAYAMSAQLASYFGAAAGFDKNQKHMTKVINMHAHESRLLDHPEATSKLHRVANALWDECETASVVQGFRNMQVTVLAPTGTIAFMMDCDTTGIEPDIALVKYKRLAGGGTLKIANNSVAAALITLGYNRADVLAGILKHIELTGSIEGAPGFSSADLPVFDCAFASTPNGRSIAPLGHVKMMVAVQPFLSGAISKTVNVPEEATVQDIFDIYTRAWEGRLKAIAVYRNNCKRMQPLQTKADNDKRLKATAPTVDPVPVPELEPTPMVISEPAPVAQALGRRRLPRTRASVTHKFTLAGHEGYLTVGKFPDGTPGELFITMNKEGSTISGLMDTIAKLVSMALQHNIPLRDMARNFIDMRFEPAGFTGLREIPSATSIVDYIFRWMELEFARPIEADADGSLPKPEAVAPGGGPPCHVCGGLTTRSGSCHVCTSCGTTSGCS